MVLQFLHEVVAGLVLPVVAEHNGGLNHHASYVIGHARYGALHYGRVGHQRALHLERAYAVAAALDDVVGAALKPVITVLVAPGHVARVVKAVVPHLAIPLGVAVVALEKADGLAVLGVDYYLALLAVLAGRAVGAHEVDVVLRIGHAHAAGLWRHPRHCAERHGCFCLAEALHQAYARKFEETVVNGGVERLAGRAAVAQGGQVVL